MSRRAANMQKYLDSKYFVLYCYLQYFSPMWPQSRAVLPCSLPQRDLESIQRDLEISQRDLEICDCDLEISQRDLEISQHDVEVFFCQVT